MVRKWYNFCTTAAVSIWIVLFLVFVFHYSHIEWLFYNEEKSDPITFYLTELATGVAAVGLYLFRVSAGLNFLSDFNEFKKYLDGAKICIVFSMWLIITLVFYHGYLLTIRESCELEKTQMFEDKNENCEDISRITLFSWKTTSGIYFKKANILSIYGVLFGLTGFGLEGWGRIKKKNLTRGMPSMIYLSMRAFETILYTR